jgi:23S rRNA (cytosine1962-C5)-methyltransferase
VAFDLAVRPIRPERVLHFDGRLLVVDKPSGIPVHGGDESLGGDLVSRLSEFLRAEGTDGYVGVHQRLDLGTSGVMVFTAAREANAEIGRAAERHGLERRYVAAVTFRSRELAARLERGDVVSLEHRLLHERGRTRVVTRGGDVAVASARLLERHGERALVELRPETGRTHQLRVQLASAGAPVAGDELYAGDRAARLLLHARELTLPDGRTFRAELPPAFAWVRGESSFGGAAAVEAALADAAILRAPLASQSDCYRLVNGEGDGLSGVTADRYGDFAVLNVYEDEARERAGELARGLIALGARGVYLKLRVRADLRRLPAEELAPKAPIAGEAAPERFLVHENGMAIHVELADGLSSGLFLDQRDNRRRVTGLAGGARVLNLFSYTGSFGVAAALGGARRVVNVDLSGRALARARDNFEANGIDPNLHAFEQTDAVEFLKRAKRGSFELVILDPPSFSSQAEGGAFRIDKELGVLAERALVALAPGGSLLAVTNHKKTSQSRLRALVKEAAARAGVALRQLKDLRGPLDCPPGPDGPTPSRSVLATRG